MQIHALQEEEVHPWQASMNNKHKLFGRPQSAAVKKQKVIVPVTQDIKAELELERRQVK